MPAALYGCETWSLKLREGRRLRVIENRVLGRILVPKRDEVTEVWRKLNNEEINDLYYSQIIIRMNISRGMRWVRNVAHMGGRKRCIKGLVGKPEGEIPLERIILKWIFRKWDMGLEID